MDSVGGRGWVTYWGTVPYDHDLRLGRLISFVTGSTQGVLDEFAPKFRVRDCLIPLDVRHLLPDPVARLYYDRSDQVTDTPSKRLIGHPFAFWSNGD